MSRRLASGLLIIGLLAGLAALLSGCSDAKSEGDGTARSAGPLPEAPPPAKTADEAVERIATWLADGKPQVLWHALPASYQRDVNTLIHDAAAKADPEVWNRTFEVLGKAARVLREKRKFILGHPMIANAVKNQPEVEEGWDAFVEILDVIVHSDAADLDKLRNIDVEAFLARTGGELLDRIAALAKLAPDSRWDEGMLGLRKVKAKILEDEGETVLIQIEQPDKPLKNERWARVEGKWIPHTLAETWPTIVSQVSQQVEALSSGLSGEDRAMYLSQLEMVDGALESLLAATTADQFNTRVSNLMGMAMTMAMSAAARAQESGAIGMGGMSAGSPSTQHPAQDLTRSVPRPHARRPRSERLRPGDEVAPNADLDRFIGQVLRVTGDDGFDFVGKLTAVTNDSLTFERRVNGGIFGFEVARSQVSTLRLYR